MAAILITDGQERASLAVVRSLGTAGHRPYVCASRRRSLAGASRYAAGTVTVPDSLTEPEEYVASVGQAVRRWAIDIVLPMTEQSLLAVLGHRAAVAPACVPCPTLEAFRDISNKQLVLAAAADLGLAVPQQQVLVQPGDRGRLDASALAYPVVIKPARSVGEVNGRRAKVGVSYASTPEALHAALGRLAPQAFPVMLQQRIVGPGVGIFLLVWGGETIAVFSHRRLREKPPSGGVSVYRESIAADDRLVESSRALLERFHWNGVAMVEFKLEASSGRPYLMEVNGRFWGSLQLAIDAGVDFPALLVACALGETPAPVRTYRTGVRSRWLWGDVDHLWARLRRSAEALGMPPGAPSRWAALRDVARIGPRTDRSEVWRWQDPMPFVRESLNWFRRR